MFRSASRKKEEDCSQAVLEVDEAAEVLEQDDRKLIDNTKGAVEKENSRHATFAAEYQNKRREVNLLLEAQSRNAPEAKRGKTSAPPLPST